MPPTEIYGLTKPKPDETIWQDIWKGIKAITKILFRTLIHIGIWTWKIFALLINWVMKWSQNQEKNAEKKMKEQERRMVILEKQGETNMREKERRMIDHERKH